jgi:CHC2-type zinc finger protein
MMSPGFQAWVQRARAVHINAVLRQRNIQLAGHGGKLAGPCPVCGGTDRFAVHLGKQLFSCRSCGGKGHGAVSFVMFADGLDFIEAVERINNMPPPASEKTQTLIVPIHDDEQTTSSALRLWREAGPIEGTVGIHYLERERSIFDLPPDAHNVLRFHRRCVFGKDEAGKYIFRGCILALCRDIVTNEPTGIHRIALDASGKLIGRMGWAGSRAQPSNSGTTVMSLSD